MDERTEREREKSLVVLVLNMADGTGLAKVVTEKMQTPTINLTNKGNPETII